MQAIASRDNAVAHGIPDGSSIKSANAYAADESVSTVSLKSTANGASSSIYMNRQDSTESTLGNGKARDQAAYEPWHIHQSNYANTANYLKDSSYTEWSEESKVDNASATPIARAAVNRPLSVTVTNTRRDRRQDVVWSDDFHDLLIALAKNHGGPDEERLFENLRKLELDFVYTAETWGRVIIEELFLPEETKTIKPLKGHGFLGGFKYEVRGVFFKFAHEIQNLVSSSDAAKLSAHELRACSAVALYALENADSSLLPPLMTVVDFRGYRLLAVSQLPVHGLDTLVYGSNDGGRSVFNKDMRFRQAIERMGRHFNLARHVSGVDNKTELYTGADVEGHFEPGRNRYYILDLGRLFPPEAPSGLSPKDEAAFIENPTCGIDCRCWATRRSSTLSPSSGEHREIGASAATALFGEEELLLEMEIGSSNPRLYKQLRPFFVQQKDAPPLSADAYSHFQSSVDSEHCNAQIEQQTKRLKTILVQRACVYLEHREVDSELYPTNFKFSQFLHERGLNVRLLGLVYLRLSTKSRWSSMCLIEMVGRAFKSLVRSRFRALARLKGGQVLAGSLSTIFRASAEDFHEEAVRLLSQLVMNIENDPKGRSLAKEREDEQCRATNFAFWEKMVRLLKHKFGLAEAREKMSNAPFLCPVRLPEILRPFLPRLLERACDALGFQVASTRVYSQPVSPDMPLPVDALQDLKPLVKHMNLIHVAEAKVLHSRALRERNQKACELLRKAKTRLEMVIKESPPTSSFFLLETLGEILFSLAIRIQPERMEFELADEALRNLMKAEGAFREIAARTTTSQELPSGPLSLDGIDPQFLSRASSHPLVLKTQQAKRFANVVSSIIMADFPKSQSLVRAGDVVAALNPREVRFWSISSKALLWSCQTTDVDITACTAVGNLFLLAKTGGKKVLIANTASFSMSEIDLSSASLNKNKQRKSKALGSMLELSSSGHELAMSSISSVRVGGLPKPSAVPPTDPSDPPSSSDGRSPTLTWSGAAPLDDYPGGAPGDASDDPPTPIDHSIVEMSLLPFEGKADEFELWSVTARGVLSIHVITANASSKKRPVQVVALARQAPVLGPLFTGKIIGFVAKRDRCVLALADRVFVLNRDLDLEQELQPPAPSTVTCLDLSDDGMRVALGTNDGKVFVWDVSGLGASLEVRSHVRPAVELKGHLSSVTSTRFAGTSWPVADTLFTCSTDRTVRVWNVRLRVCVRVLAGHLDAVNSLVYAEREKLLVTSSADARVRTWRFDHVPFLPVNSPDNPVASTSFMSQIFTGSTATAIGGSNTSFSSNEPPKGVSENRRGKRKWMASPPLSSCMVSGTVGS